MGNCADSSKNVGFLRRPLDPADIQSKKKQNLIEYALRKKVHCILDIVNSKVPFEVVK